MGVCEQDVAQVDSDGGCFGGIHEAEQKVSQQQHVGQLLEREMDPFGQKEYDVFELFSPFFGTDEHSLHCLLLCDMNEQL